MVTKGNTIPPHIAQELKKARGHFRLNVALLTFMLILMGGAIFLFGPVGFARAMVVCFVYLALYAVFLFSIIDAWQTERAGILKNRNNDRRPSTRSHPRISKEHTAPTSRIDVEEMKKRKSGGNKTGGHSPPSSS